MIANKILETKLINQYDKMYRIFAQANTLKLNLSDDNIIQGLIQDVSGKNVNSTYKKEILTPYGTLSNGDYITHTYISNGVEKNINYICESESDKEIGCEKFYLLQCPFDINIFAWNYSDILKYPIALRNNNASLSLTETTVSITNNSSFDIIMKYDVNTRSFVTSTNVINGIEHDMITRVLIDGMAFKKIGTNHLINKGILVISFENTNISPTDNLDLQVADYVTYYREPIDYNKLIDDEIIKYETTATVTKDILTNADVSNIIKKLKVGQTANADVSVSVSEVDADNLLTLTDGVVRLTSQIPFESLDNTTTATLTFSAGGISKTLLVNVNIEKQNEIVPDDITVDDEVLKYETTAFISNTIPTGTDITATIMKLKADTVANPEVNTVITSVDTDNLLTLNGGITTLTNQLAYDASDTSTFAVITFSKGEIVRTLTIDVTIEKLLPQSDFEFAVAEIMKYETTAFIGANIIAGTDVTSTVLKLKDGQVANPEVDIYCSWVDADGLLSLSGRVVTLIDVVPFTATDNETMVEIKAQKGSAVKSAIVTVTIEKQEEQSAPTLTITEDNGYEDLPIGETNTYTINTTDYVTWSVTNVNGGLTLNTTAGSNKCSVICANNTDLINKQETLTATVNVNGTEFEYHYIIYIVGLI